jgi:predicted secreted hydrolase
MVVVKGKERKMGGTLGERGMKSQPFYYWVEHWGLPTSM